MVRGDARWIQCWGGNVDSSVTKEEETTGRISLLLEGDRFVWVRQVFAGAKGEAISEAQGGTQAEAAGGSVAEQVVNDPKSDYTKSSSQGDLDTQAKRKIGIVPVSVAPAAGSARWSGSGCWSRYGILR